MRKFSGRISESKKKFLEVVSKTSPPLVPHNISKKLETEKLHSSKSQFEKLLKFVNGSKITAALAFILMNKAPKHSYVYLVSHFKALQKGKLDKNWGKQVFENAVSVGVRRAFAEIPCRSSKNVPNECFQQTIWAIFFGKQSKSN